MIRTDGFVDLRVGHQSWGSADEETFWPSFTDIMTVVVMIFLMALVVILIRNFELVQQLRATMEAEREAAAQARSLATESIHLEQQLVIARDNLESTRTALTATERQRDEAQASARERGERIDRLLGQIAGLESLRDRLTAEKAVAEGERDSLASAVEALGADYVELERLRDRLVAEVASLGAARSAAESRADELETVRTELESRVAELASQRDELAREVDTLGAARERLDEELAVVRGQFAELVRRHALAEQDRDRREAEVRTLEERLGDLTASNERLIAELELASRRADLTSAELDTLEGEYLALEERYNRLIRPARSEVGRYVVEIRYRRTADDGYSYEIREPGQLQYRRVSEQELKSRLDVLKARDPERLYTKIIIPEDSGLSYNEAWRFTNDILSNYDYYQQ